MLKVDVRSFAYEDRVVLHNIQFELEAGDHLALLGESGCGKSTLLHVIYGLLDLDKGHLSWGDKPMLGPNFNLIPGEPFIKLVAQEFNVMPFTTAFENIAEHLPRRDLEEDGNRVRELLDVVGLTEKANVLVRNLSGGQKQRVALAKALAKQPELLLLDEPFSHIDSFRKQALRRRLYSYLKEQGIACITATHDSEEALAFSDQVIILREGTVETSGSPQAVYQNVDSAYQAGFFGEINRIPEAALGGTGDRDLYIKSHQWEVTQTEEGITVEVKQSYFKGSHYLVEAQWKDRKVYFQNPVDLRGGTFVSLDLKSSK